MLREDPLRGVLLVSGASLLFAISDTIAKYVSQTLPVVEIAWIRYVLFVVLALLPALRPGMGVVRTARPKLQVARGLATIASAIMFILGLRLLPLADAAAINFVSPLFITALSVPLLGEKVGLGRWLAVAAGLFGAVVAAQPGTAAFRTAAVFPLLSASFWALAIIATRRMAGSERPATTIFWTAASGLVALSILLPFEARWPTAEELALCLLIGLVAWGGQWLLVLGYRFAQASHLAPFSYLQLVWVTGFGYLVFAARPALATIVGATIIVASGLYAARRRTPGPQGGRMHGGGGRDG